MHRTSIGRKTGVRTSSAHYRTLRKIHGALILAIAEITGKVALWVRSNTGPCSASKKYIADCFGGGRPK